MLSIVDGAILSALLQTLFFCLPLGDYLRRFKDFACVSAESGGPLLIILVTFGGGKEIEFEMNGEDFAFQIAIEIME